MSRRRIAVDRLARRVVILGGMAIIASILAILAVIVIEFVPLFMDPEIAETGTFGPVTPGRPLVAGIDEYRQVGFFLDDRGRIQYLSLDGRDLPGPLVLPGLGEGRPVSAVAAGPGRYIVGTSIGRAVPFDLRFEVAYGEEGRTVHPRLEGGEPLDLDPDRRRPITRIASGGAPGGGILAALAGPDEIVLLRERERRALIGDSARDIERSVLRVDVRSPVTALAIDDRGERLFAGTAAGQLLHYDLRTPAGARLIETLEASSRPGAGISVLGFLIGDRTLITGDRAGGVSSWQVVRREAGAPERLKRMHIFDPHPAGVSAFARSMRDKGFVTADESGRLMLRHGTSGSTLLPAQAPSGGIERIVMAPKGDGILALSGEGAATHWSVRDPHPGITLSILFGKVWYEGYDGPEHVWQSTGGTDEFEPKYGLTPLIFGTLKGTFYALLFAVPLALLAALYTSQFMHPSVRAFIKPGIEIMAALPSVVLGFLGGLWLAPVIERVVPALALLPWILAVLILAGAWIWRRAPAAITGRTPRGFELVLLSVIVLGGFGLALLAGGVFEGALLAGDYRTWLLQALGLTYDQRNSIVVGVAMGFAVIPMIFTIAEDSLSNVPAHLTAGSLALGATRWQTALRVVLPTASPGIFSAVMIGFGRAVGETMIVLMATGNTPIMDWSIFNGFRALSANIAVELPEAPDGGTLFRILFLAAFLLFTMTFAVNTAAEIVRLRLRERYRYL